MATGSHRARAQCWERGLRTLYQPKQRHTFVTLSPWSAFWLMFCQFHALGSLRSNCQRHKAGGSGGWRMSDVTESWMKKRVSMFGMCWGGFQAGESEAGGLRVMPLVLSMCYFSDSLLETCMWSYSFNKACVNIMLRVKCLRTQCIALWNWQENPFSTVRAISEENTSLCSS